MHKRKIIFGCLVLALSVLTACQKEQSIKPLGTEEAKVMLEAGKYEPQKQTAETKAEQSVLKNGDMNVVSYTEEDDDKSVAIFYPEFQNGQIDDSLHEYVMSKLAIFNELIKSQKTGENLLPELNMDFDSDRIAGNLYALEFRIDSEISSDMSFKRSEIVIVNTEKQAVLTDIQLLSDNFNQREHLYGTLLVYMQNDSSIAPYLDADKLEDWVFDEANDFSNTEFNENHLKFTFKQGEAASKAAGEPAVEIPLSELLDAMPESISELLR